MTERSSLSQLPGTHLTTASFAAATATNTLSSVAWRNITGSKIRITSLDIIFDTAVTGAATNNFTVSAVNRELNGAGAIDVIVTKAFDNGIDAVAFQADPQTLATTVADREMEPNEVLNFKKGENGTGLDMPAGMIVIGYQFV